MYDIKALYEAASVEEAIRLLQEHPEAQILVHPECVAAVAEAADYVGSTTGIMKYAKESECSQFVIGTENSIVEHLRIECPDKQFTALSPLCVCQNMRITTLEDLYGCIMGTCGEEILLSEEEIVESRRPIDRMIELGG